MLTVVDFADKLYKDAQLYGITPCDLLNRYSDNNEIPAEYFDDVFAVWKDCCAELSPDNKWRRHWESVRDNEVISDEDAFFMLFPYISDMLNDLQEEY